MKLGNSFCCFVVCCSMSCLGASAQEVVHALQGKVLNVDTKAGTILLSTNDGTSGAFKDLANQKATDAVEKDLRTEMVPADKFTAKGDQVVLLYEGYGNERTAVAVRDVGPKVSTSIGTVERYDKHARVLTLKTDAGKQMMFQVDAKTVADAPEGATDGLRFEPPKGQHVKVASTPVAGGDQVAVFIGAAE